MSSVSWFKYLNSVQLKFYILSWNIILHQLAEEIDIEIRNFNNFPTSVTLTLDRVTHQSTYQISFKSEKLFVDGRTDDIEIGSILGELT